MSGGFRPSLRRSEIGPLFEAAFLASDHIDVKRVGVTLDSSKVVADANGDKIVKAGTLINEIDANGKYAPYDSAATDGRQDVDAQTGFTLESANLRDGDVIVGQMLHGSVLEARVTVPGGVTAAVKTGLQGRIWFQ